MSQHQSDGLTVPSFIHPKTENKIFPLSLVLSVLMHGLILGSLFYANVRYGRVAAKDMEIVYRMDTKEPTPPRASSRGIKSLQGKRRRPDPKVLTRKETLPPPVLKEIKKNPARIDSSQKKFAQLPFSDTKRFVSVPLLDSGKITNPKYLNYHENIRHRIRDRAYLYVDSPEFKTGEVYLTFVLLADGSLKDVLIRPEKTTANDYLKNVGLRSIKESSPFPPFPADLDYPELSFNVIISFRVNE